MFESCDEFRSLLVKEVKKLTLLKKNKTLRMLQKLSKSKALAIVNLQTTNNSKTLTLALSFTVLNTNFIRLLKYKFLR